MLIRQTRPLISLKRIGENCKENSAYTGSTVGVVIDMTCPVFRQRDNDYVMQIKVVDETLNNHSVFDLLVIYCSVYLFVKKDRLKSLNLGNIVGQLILLDNCSFSIWNHIKLETRYLHTAEKIVGFDVVNEKIKVLGKLGQQEQGDIINEDVRSRGIILKNWFNLFFYSKYKPFLGIHLINAYCVMADPFSLILKYKKKTNMIEQKSQLEEEDLREKIFFQDSNQNTFFMYRQDYKYEFPDSQYLFFRAVKCVGNYYEIVLSETGHILGLPGNFAKQYEKQMNYCAISRFSQKFLLSSHRTCRLSKINYIIPEVTPISQLLKAQDLYQNKQMTRDELRVEDYYMVEAVVINFQGKLHLFHVDYQIIIHEDYFDYMSGDEKKQLLEEGKIRYLYEGVIGLMDRSSQSMGKLFFVHLFSNQERTQFFDPALLKELNNTVGMAYDKALEQRTKERIDGVLKGLIEKSDFKNTVSMLIEPIKSDGLVYRLSHTIFY